MALIETQRLQLRRLLPEDAPFILQLLNEPSFIRHIGDKGVRSMEDAREYILNGPVRSYAKHRFGLYLVEKKGSHAAIGVCGLIKRTFLDSPDIGFAFLPEYWGKGYATEAAAAVMKYARNHLQIDTVVALVAPDNTGSMRVLEKLGLHYSRNVKPPAPIPESLLFTAEGHRGHAPEK